jgi:hypothetical protein
MARLKVKQISDFDSKVQALIDGDNDQNATIIGAISTEADAVSSALAAEILATNGDVTTLTALAGSISSDLAAEILATNGDVNTLTALAGSISGDVDTVEANLAAEILATNGDVNTLTALAGTISTELVDEIDSVDTRFGTIATSTSLGSLESRVSLDEDALAAEIGATNSDVSTLTTLAGSISSDLAAEILATNGDVNTLTALAGSISSDVDVVEAGIVTLDTYIDGVSADLAAEISTTDGEISTLQGKVTQLEGDSTYIHDYAAMAGVDQFRCTVQVEHASDDDMQVFINGHAIGRVRTVSVDGVDTKYGWEHNSNNTTFDLHNIGMI